VDPLVPMVVLWGMLGLVRLREGWAGRTARLRLAVMALGGLAVFLTTFPMDGYKFPNVLSVWYVEPMREFLDPAPTEAVEESPATHVAPPPSGAQEAHPEAGVPPSPVAAPSPATRARRPSLGDRLGLPPWVDVRRPVIAVAALVFIAPFVLRPRFLSRRYAPWTVGLLVLLNVPLILQQVRVSRDADRMNAIPKWLCDHAAPGERLYFDEGDYYRGKGMYLFYATCFWNPRMEIGRYRREVAALDPQYVVSWDRFKDFRLLLAAGLGADRRYLYSAEGVGAPDVILDDPRYFDVARVPPGTIENAWEVEADAWVWTKRQTRFRFQYDLPPGPWILALSAGGPRPRYNPAKLRITAAAGRGGPIAQSHEGPRQRRLAVSHAGRRRQRGRRARPGDTDQRVRPLARPHRQP
jgi:hypothetical protein